MSLRPVRPYCVALRIRPPPVASSAGRVCEVEVSSCNGKKKKTFVSYRADFFRARPGMGFCAFFVSTVVPMLIHVQILQIIIRSAPPAPWATLYAFPPWCESPLPPMVV